MSNDEKILELLAKQGELLTKHGEMLAKLTEKVDKLETVQSEQSAALLELKSDVGALKEDVGEIRDTASRVAIMQENVVLPRLNTLAEGHTHLTQTLASKKQVDKIEELVEEKVVVLESVVKSHSARITALEKAQ